MGDQISRQEAIADAQSWVAANGFEQNLQNKVIEWLKEFPPAQPEPFGAIKHAGSEHPLSDEEIIPRLRQIQEQIGGSYAIDRVIELLTARHIDADGTLWITVPDIEQVTRVIVDEEKSKFCRQFYMDREPEIGRWIPCSERLPEEDGTYRVTIDPDYLTPDMVPTEDLYWHEGKWKYCDIVHHPNRMPELKLFELEATVLAWKPLEEPYKEQRG